MKDKELLLFIAIGALLMAATGGVIYMGARGLRNNNPGNIRHSASKWQGMSTPQTDKDYIQFDDPVYGIRALAKLLKNYQEKYNLRTIEEIINRWAPPSENITSAYVEHVARVVGVNKNATIDVNDHLVPIVTTIIAHENGKQPYPPETILKGISLA